MHIFEIFASIPCLADNTLIAELLMGDATEMGRGASVALDRLDGLKLHCLPFRSPT